MHINIFTNSESESRKMPAHRILATHTRVYFSYLQVCTISFRLFSALSIDSNHLLSKCLEEGKRGQGWLKRMSCINVSYSSTCELRVLLNFYFHKPNVFYIDAYHRSNLNSSTSILLQSHVHCICSICFKPEFFDPFCSFCKNIEFFLDIFLLFYQ